MTIFFFIKICVNQMGFYSCSNEEKHDNQIVLCNVCAVLLFNMFFPFFLFFPLFTLSSSSSWSIWKKKFYENHMPPMTMQCVWLCFCFSWPERKFWWESMMMIENNQQPSNPSILWNYMLVFCLLPDYTHSLFFNSLWSEVFTI